MAEEKKVPMFYLNTQMLKGRIVEKGYNLTTFAKAIGISRSALHDYMKDPSKIPYGVLLAMAETLCKYRGDALNILARSPKVDPESDSTWLGSC